MVRSKYKCQFKQVKKVNKEGYVCKYELYNVGPDCFFYFLSVHLRVVEVDVISVQVIFWLLPGVKHEDAALN